VVPWLLIWSTERVELVELELAELAWFVALGSLSAAFQEELEVHGSPFLVLQKKFVFLGLYSALDGSHLVVA
jgi:hypothetical protein